MKIISVTDVNSEAHLGRFDAVIVFLGYERRASFLVHRRSDTWTCQNRIAVTYRGDEDRLSRSANLRAINKCDFGVHEIDKGYEKAGLLAALRSSGVVDIPGEIRILLDYSSMRRVLYSELFSIIASGLLNARTVEIVFNYSIGEYGGKHTPKVVEDYVPLSGLEGRIRQGRRKLAVFNLGFEPVSTLSLYEGIEADEVIAIVADPGSNKGSADFCRRLNTEFLTRYASKFVKAIPLRSVERYCATMIETLKRMDDERDVLFAPNGPKPHVLGSIICCYQVSAWANLYIQGSESVPIDVNPTGEQILTKVIFERVS